MAISPDQFAAITEMLRHIENAAYSCGSHSNGDSKSYAPFYQRLVSDRAELLGYLSRLVEKPKACEHEWYWPSARNQEHCKWCGVPRGSIPTDSVDNSINLG